MSDGPSASAEIQTLYELYAQDVYRYAWFNLDTSAVAEDVVQEVYLRALGSWNSFRHDSSAKTWLIAIARNYIYDSYRKRKTEDAILQDYGVRTGNDEFTTTNDIMDLRDALSRMKENYRQAVILRYIQMLSAKEAGAVLGWSEAKVRWTTHRGLQQLRGLLSSDDEEGDRQ